MSRPTRNAPYQLVIRGELDDRYGYLFEGMQIVRATGTTIITGQVRDQADLYGFIERLEELGLELLSVQRLVPIRPTTHETSHPAA